MTTASELSDELEARAVELETFASSRPEYDTPPAFAGVLRQSASSLRRVEKLEGALSRIANAKPDELCDEANTGILTRAIKIASQALTGEA